tara:strand:- start:381 stop:578 length:198 start_codon:yes stop_codon:yes gene_type:complete
MKKDFKPHLMCPKNGKAKMAKTYEEHLKYKEMGWGHDCMDKKKTGGQVQGCGCPYGMNMGPNTVL